MAKVKIADLSTISGAVASGDLLVLVDIDDTIDSAAGTTKKVTAVNLLTAGINAEFGNLTTTGTTTLGDASGDAVTINAATITLANDTNFVLSGGVNGVSFDTNVLSIDATNDRVGIGTTNPTGNMDIYRTAAPTVDGTSNALVLRYFGGNATGSLGAGINFAQRYDATDTVIVRVGGIYGVKTNATASFGGGLTFHTQPHSSADLAEIMRITGSGNVGMGTTTPLSKLSINGGLHVGGDSDAGDNNALIDGTLGVTGVATFSSNIVMGVYSIVPSGTLNYLLGDASNSWAMGYNTSFVFGNNNGSLNVGTVYNPANTTTWNTTSDERTKTEITNADLVKCYDLCKNVQLKYYALKDEYFPEIQDKHRLGWLAQDVETYLPKAINISQLKDLSDCKSINADQIYTAMYGAVQLLIQKVEILESK